MPPFLSEPPALIFEVVVYCWIFLSPAPKLVRYGVLSFAINTALRAMPFEGSLALAARVLSAAVAAILLVMWAYQVSNRPRKQSAQAAH